MGLCKFFEGRKVRRTKRLSGPDGQVWVRVTVAGPPAVRGGQITVAESVYRDRVRTTYVPGPASVNN